MRNSRGEADLGAQRRDHEGPWYRYICVSRLPPVSFYRYICTRIAVSTSSPSARVVSHRVRRDATTSQKPQRVLRSDPYLEGP
jgi:hypothetical protein